MITIKYEDYKLQIHGHAGFGEQGRDIICSAVSALFYAAVRYFTEEGSEYLSIPCQIKAKCGNAEIKCTPKEEFIDDVKHAYDLICGGLRLIVSNYPQNVRFI